MPTSQESRQSPANTATTGEANQTRSFLPNFGAADTDSINESTPKDGMEMVGKGRKRRSSSDKDDDTVDSVPQLDASIAEEDVTMIPKKRKKTNKSLEESSTDSSGIPAISSGGDQSEGGEGVMARVEDMNTCVKRITTETRQLFSKWQEQFSESERFEVFCPTRVDELLKEALALEQSIIAEKDKLRKRLKMLSKTLSTELNL